MNSQTISANSYVPPYVSPDLKWYERDGLMTYVDRPKYERFEKDRESYLQNAKITDFDIIHHECRGDELISTIRLLMKKRLIKCHLTIGKKPLEHVSGQKEKTYMSKRSDVSLF